MREYNCPTFSCRDSKTPFDQWQSFFFVIFLYNDEVSVSSQKASVLVFLMSVKDEITGKEPVKVDTTMYVIDLTISYPEFLPQLLLAAKYFPKLDISLIPDTRFSASVCFYTTHRP